MSGHKDRSGILFYLLCFKSQRLSLYLCPTDCSFQFGGIFLTSGLWLPLDGDVLQRLLLRMGCIFAVTLKLNSSEIKTAWLYAVILTSRLDFLAHYSFLRPFPVLLSVIPKTKQWKRDYLRHGFATQVNFVTLVFCLINFSTPLPKCSILN